MTTVLAVPVPRNFRRASLRSLRIRVGEYNLYQAELGHTSQDLVAERFLVHPRFGSPKRLSNDIGLVKLASEVPLSSYAVPACLPSPGDKRLYAAGKNGTVAGWGYVRELRLGEQPTHAEPGGIPGEQLNGVSALPGLRTTGGCLGEAACTETRGVPRALMTLSSPCWKGHFIQCVEV